MLYLTPENGVILGLEISGYKGGETPWNHLAKALLVWKNGKLLSAYIRVRDYESVKYYSRACLDKNAMSLAEKYMGIADKGVLSTGCQAFSNYPQYSKTLEVEGPTDVEMWGISDWRMLSKSRLELLENDIKSGLNQVPMSSLKALESNID